MVDARDMVLDSLEALDGGDGQLNPECFRLVECVVLRRPVHPVVPIASGLQADVCIDAIQPQGTYGGFFFERIRTSIAETCTL